MRFYSTFYSISYLTALPMKSGNSVALNESKRGNPRINGNSALVISAPLHNPRIPESVFVIADKLADIGFAVSGNDAALDGRP